MPDRRLAAVMVTDMVGFTALMGADQDHAVDLLNRGHEILKSIVAGHHGQWLEDSGDRSLTAFPSAVDAVGCALEILARLRDETELQLRIGVDVGDILVAGNHVYGDTVNIASFIERLADPQGLVITESVYEAVRDRVDLNVIDLGEKVLKNVGHPVRLFALTGTKQRHRVVNLLSTILSRRVPHITGAYLAASWAVIEVVEWLASQGAISHLWVYGTFAGLVSMVPSVVLATWSHGAHGRERVTRAEKIGLPLNAVLAAFAVFYVVQNVEAPQSGARIEPASVAVLPFVNLGDDRESDYFSLGLSEEVINALAKVPGLYVASRTSSFMFDDSTEDPRKIAQQLRVATLLEGSVRRQGDKVRVTAQLIDGFNNYHLWSETYDREMSDIFEIQEDIAAAVALELVGLLKPEVFEAFAAARAATLEAFDYYLRGLDYLRRPLGDESLATARRLFELAIDDDPDYAQAFAGLCEVALQEYLLFRSPDNIDQAESACLHALELDAGARDVRYALGELYRHTGDYEASAQVFEQLIARRKSARALVGLGLTRFELGDVAGSDEAFQDAIRREPGVWHHRLPYARLLSRQGRYDEALQQVEKVVELSPDNARAFLVMGLIYDYMGDMQASLRVTLRSLAIAPSRNGYRDLGLTYYYLGDYAQAVDAHRKAVELGPDDHWSWGSLAQAYEALGDDAAASDAFERAALNAEAILERNPRDWVTLSRLAVYNVLNGAEELGLEQIETAKIEGSHLAYVNLNDAIIRSQLGQREQTLDALERAIATGTPKRMLAMDPQFAELRDDARFRRLVGE